MTEISLDDLACSRRSAFPRSDREEWREAREQGKNNEEERGKEDSVAVFLAHYSSRGPRDLKAWNGQLRSTKSEGGIDDKTDFRDSFC